MLPGCLSRKTLDFVRQFYLLANLRHRWLYPAEINPLRTRARANALSTISNWLFNFLIVMVTPVMISSIGWGTYLFFAVVNASFIPIIYFFYPETARRSLEEIDLIFAKGYLEKISYVKAAEQLPRLNDREIENMAREYGFIGADEETKLGSRGNSINEKGEATEKEGIPTGRSDSEATVAGHEGLRND